MRGPVKIGLSTVALKRLDLLGVGRVTISSAVTTMGPTESIEIAARRADEALYRAKAGGRNRAEASCHARHDEAA